MPSDARRRKIPKEQNGKIRPMNKKRKNAGGQTSLQGSMACLFLSSIILFTFIFIYVDHIPWHLGHRAVDNVAKNLGYFKPDYAVVIDAGSTGSRVNAFTFHESYIGSQLILDKSLFKYNKPGLSSFADNPAQGVESIKELIELAKNEIPEQYWSKTPLILRATAGLRLLPTEKSENLLQALREYFETLPFLTKDKAVEIMDGTDEGIFSWFTVNFLISRISGDPSQTVAALDLGGGSTQVTFAPSSLKDSPHHHKAITPRGLIPVYTNSFLGLGLMAARKEVVTHNQGDQTNVTSECVNHVIQNKHFRYGNVDYFVSGPKSGYPVSKENNKIMPLDYEKPIINFEKCAKIVQNYVISKAKEHPDELPSKNIFAFSYYFDKAVEADLIDELTGGKIKVSQLKEAAKKVCHQANTEQPFICLDLIFIWTLLEKGFGIPESTEINLFKKINGHEINWALGLAYDLLKA